MEIASEYSSIPHTFTADARMLATLRLLIDAGGSVHSQDKFGCTALQYASRFGRRLLVNALLDAGASVDVRNCNGWTVRLSLLFNLSIVLPILLTYFYLFSSINSGTTLGGR